VIYKQHKFISHGSGVGNSKLMSPVDSMYCEIDFLAHRTILVSSHMVEKVKGFGGASFIRILILFMKAPPSQSSPEGLTS
jgi:hypothetical protein